jgi:hypothetical protein
MANYYFLDKKLPEASVQISSFVQNKKGYTFLSGYKSNSAGDSGDSLVYAYLNGTLIWQCNYESPDNNTDGVLSSSADINGDIFISGHGSYFNGIQLSSSTSAEDGYISKLNYLDGSVLWAKKVDITKAVDHVTSISSSSDGGSYFLASGGGWYGSSKFENYKSVVFKSDANGNIAWQKTISSENNVFISNNGSVETQINGDVIATGLFLDVVSFEYPKNNKFFIKTFDSSGNLKYSYTSPNLVSSETDSVVYSIAEKSDGKGNTYICWTTWDYASHQLANEGLSARQTVHLQKFNSKGLVWSKESSYDFASMPNDVNSQPISIKSLGILTDGTITLIGNLNLKSTASINGVKGFGGQDFVLINANAQTGVLSNPLVIGDKTENSASFGSVDNNGDVFFSGAASYGLKTSSSNVINQIQFSDSKLEGYGYGLTLYGTDTKDVMSGSGFDDQLYGKYGDDVIQGLAGADEIFGDYGADNIKGGTGEDYLYGGYGKDQLYGEGGDDLVYGEQGDDFLYGGDGDDLIDGGTGADYMCGGKGNDMYFVDSPNDKIEDKGASTDNDTVIVTQSVQYTLAANIEDAELDAGAGKAGLTGNALNNDLTGNDQANSLNGGDGADVLNGGGGSDSLSGGTGNDVIDAGAGSDTVTGDSGNDVIDGGVGIDSISYKSALAAVNIDLALGTASSIAANDAAKIGVDDLIDLENVIASNYNDIVKGGAGANVLTGGLGTDSLYAGADKGKDIFDFNAITESKTGTARDKVYDFITKIDKIDLSGIDANTATAKTAIGDQAFLFNNTTAKANSVWYAAKDVDGSTATKDVIVYGDVNGDGKADFEIGLVGVTSVAVTDFVL